jgi:hypothetical protein
MSWIFWLGGVAVLIAIAAVTGLKPRHTRHVARTQMMDVGRVVLVLIAVVIAVGAYMAWHGRS